MVLQFSVGSKLGLVFGVILLGSSMVGSTAMGQTNGAAETPFIGFRPFDSNRQLVPSASTSGAGSTSVSANAQQAAQRTEIIPAQPASAYPYPASGSPAFGTTTAGQTGTAERTAIGGRLSSVLTPTGGLDGASGQATSPVGNVDPALWQRYQQELQQQQTAQQYQQYQQWLAQQQRNNQIQQSSAVGFRTQQANTASTATPAPTPAAEPTRAAVPTQATRSSTTASTRPKLGQAVVQQVSSTTTGNRDRSVAQAAFPASTNNTSVAKQATSAASTVAKPQCCCVPQNCCVAVQAQPVQPTTPAPVFRPQAPVFRPQAANLAPSLVPSTGSVPGGFLGQTGANFQVQPQTGFQQFQQGLGVPQFNTNSSFGSGGSWFSNGLLGTGAYTPLLPLVNAQGARLGQGIIGQPTAYLDGQPLRNLLRYIFP